MGHLPENLSTVEDFLENDAFRAWVLERQPQDRLYWQAWLVQHPEKREMYEQAVVTLLALQGKQIELSDQHVKDRASEIVDQMPDARTVHKPLLSWYWGRWMSAAAAIGLMIWFQVGSPVFSPSSKPSGQTKQAVASKEWKIVKNVTGQSLVVLLPDNSSVLLSTGSELRFRRQTSHALREVYLQGEGFFEVAKNPAKPFIVYTNNLTTKVLGTSFQVHSFAKEATSYVKVKTGKVTVTPVSSPDKPILLTVNQELKLGAATKQLIKHNHFVAEDGPDAIVSQQFTFNYTPIPAVFDQLAASYHMPIHYDQQLLHNCTFTGQLNDVPFLEKIRLICLTTESSYEVIDNQVVIHSAGCN
ncbi:FecR family protein [Spirosoma panaciterrae]|uniref:FecR family protein n=1 Tax=Spirosoma panaciterrae TaxID=496058 RepID=UPI0003643444|nr:FecR family protein [Spirosoma panaciterrae]